MKMTKRENEIRNRLAELTERIEVGEQSGLDVSALTQEQEYENELTNDEIVELEMCELRQRMEKHEMRNNDAENARLIAAAPEMYIELKALIAAIDNTEIGFGSDMITAPMRKSRKYARALLARIEGSGE